MTKKRQELTRRFSLRVCAVDYAMYLAWERGFKFATEWRRQNEYITIVTMPTSFTPHSNSVSEWKQSYASFKSRVREVVKGQKVRIGQKVNCAINIWDV